MPGQNKQQISLKKPVFVNPKFVKTCDELIEEENEVTGSKSRSPSRSRRFSRARIGRE